MSRKPTWTTSPNFAKEILSLSLFPRIEKVELIDKLVFEIPCGDYIKDFETLWLLSQGSFSERRLDAFAEKHGKKEKSISVATVIKKLNEDIQLARVRLTESFEACNEKRHLSRDLIGEGVQKLLDRLLFLRVYARISTGTPRSAGAFRKMGTNQGRHRKNRPQNRRRGVQAL